jgi:hypothetical protein
MEHESARTKIRRYDYAGDDALVVARRAGFHGRERHGGAFLPPTGCEEELDRFTVSR